MHNVFARKSFAQLFFKVWLCNFLEKKLIKLTTGVDFTSILTTVYVRKDLKAAKIQSIHQCLFVLLGSLPVKAAHKTLVNLTKDSNPRNLRT